MITLQAKKTRRVYIADLFCGSGGTSTGAAMACEELGVQANLVAVNHWDLAVESHAANHPWAQHYCMSLDAMVPAKAVPGGRLDLLIASPDCTDHSNAKGGKPRSDQGRASAFLILKWLQELDVHNLLIENVPEFLNWGPLGSDGKPLKSKRGELFQLFWNTLICFGYKLEKRIVTCADYGDATTRKRLFIMGRKQRGREISWPRRSHASTADLQNEMFSDLKQWRSAREIINWKNPGTSIFDRKKPLAQSTIDRIAAGLRKFSGPAADPFLVMLYGTGEARSIERPLPTVTAGGQHIGLCQPNPFMLLLNRKQDAPLSVDKPMPTVTATSSDFALCQPQPFIISAGGPVGQGRNPRSIDEPMATVMTEDHHALVNPFILSMEHGKPQPFIMPVNHGGKDSRVYSMDRPMPTVTTVDAWGLVEPFLMSYYGTTNVSSVKQPVPTVTTKDRFALVEPRPMDILFRMLEPGELAASHSFPETYEFKGTREQVVKQIGNSVPCRTGKALCMERLRDTIEAA